MAKKNAPRTTIVVGPPAQPSLPVPANKATSNVGYVRREVCNRMPSWLLIRDCIAGELAIKGLVDMNEGFNIVHAQSLGDPLTYNGGGKLPYNLSRAMRYLPQPNPGDLSNENSARYLAYLTRAIFYEVTGRTLGAMVGEVFHRAPETNIPDQLQPMVLDADTAGMSLDEVAYAACRKTLAYGRSGLLVDYPALDRATSKAEAESGDVKPFFRLYEPWNIINWRTEQVRSKTYYTLVVLREYEEIDTDEFVVNILTNYRVLKLVNGVYQVTMYRSNGGGGFTVTTMVPKDAKGKPFTEINFKFIGSENNNVLPDAAPLYSLASVNIGHYRNSADYEESCFIVGQPTPVLIGVTQQWVTEVWKGGVELGSRAAISLPAGGNAILLQATENTMPHEAMLMKEDQMVSLGAKLVQPAAAPGGKSATGSLIEDSSEKSTLANVANNVSAAITWGLKIAAAFVGIDPTEITYDLNDEFDISTMSPDDQNALIKLYQTHLLTFEETRSALKKSGKATSTAPAADVLTQVVKEGKQMMDAGLVEDPNAVNVPAPKAKSGAGGPQPGSQT